MTMLQVDGFDHYGTYDGSDGEGVANMLSGTYAQADSTVVIGAPAWGARSGQYALGNHIGTSGARRVLESAKDVLIVGFGWSIDQLPNTNGMTFPISFRDSSNLTIGGICVESTGTISARKSSKTTSNGKLDTVIATTATPVVVTRNWHYFEMKIAVTAGTFELKVDGTTVLDLSDVTWSNSGDIEQYNLILGDTGTGFNTPVQWLDDLNVRDDSGDLNNDFLGDLRVATLFPNADGDDQGWTAEPRHRYGTGVLDNRAQNSSCVTCAVTTATNLGSGDFTIEGDFRFNSLPTGTNKAQLFGKWDETNNRRSYQLYMGGPSLDSGNLVFRISTDGTAATVSELISWPWVPDLDVWYNVVVCRTGGELLLFIDGIQQGLPITDANTYYAGNAPTSLGAQCEGTTTTIGNTAFDGFQDEFRLTVGVGRYSANFTPTGPFPRNSTDDPDFASVAWLSGWDAGIADESSFHRTLTARSGSVAITPDDGDAAYQTINHPTPQDDTFIQAALTAAFSTLTLTGAGTAGKTITVGTSDGSTAAVYTLRAAVSAAFDVKIGATAADTLANLIAAINAATGAGTLYGTGTTANADVTASALPDDQLLVTASTAGTAGNSIATSTDEPTASWTGTTLAGGADIPSHSDFGFQRLPNGTTLVRSVSIVHRDFKSDSGTASVQATFVAPLGGTADGEDNALTTTPTYYTDILETDPDTDAALSPTTIIGGRVRVNRTA
jgi:hypothetical protein